MNRSKLTVLAGVFGAICLTIICGCVQQAGPISAGDPSGAAPAAQAAGKIRIATVQFAESYRPRENAAVIRRYIVEAKRRGADVVHFHECALSGYAGKVASADYDWRVLREAAESVLAEAKRQQIWVILGSSHPLTSPHKPHNSLYLISPDGEIVDRYDKRFCTEADLKTYSPGDHFAIFTLNGVKCSMLICYDVRFPELYRGLYQRGVRVLFQSFHNARRKRGGGLLGKIMRPSMQTRAATNAMWVSAPNSSAYYSCWPSSFITPEGIIADELEINSEGMMINTVDVNANFYDSSGPFRERAMRGILHSGQTVDDSRSEDRKSL